jgi:hypothetical protein
MIRVAAKLCLSFSTETGDRAVKRVHWIVDAGREVRVLASPFIAKKKKVPFHGEFLIRSEHDEEVISALKVHSQLK